MNKTVLIIAFHFPPVATSSGMQRALKTARYLLEDNWRPVVLTANERAYPKVNPSQLAEIPPEVHVSRTFCLDATRHLAIRGRYPGVLAWPDRWVSWWPGAVREGRRLIRQYRPSAIWSTFPITTTNLVAGHLAKWSGLPWIADLRDPITLEGYPRDPMRFRLARRIEAMTIERASRVIFTAEFTRSIYRDRYPQLRGRDILIPNGFDENNFPDQPGIPAAKDSTRIKLVHSGSLQPKGRNPLAFFTALRDLKSAGKISSERITVVFRGAGFEERYTRMAQELGVEDLVEFPGHLPYDEAIREMVEADGLLLFQGTVYNHAVPAKVYEYFFARKPILGILDPQGETQRVLNNAGISKTADIDSPASIASGLAEFIKAPGGESPFLPDLELIQAYSRRNQTLKLATVLCDVISQSEQAFDHESRSSSGVAKP